MRQNVPVAFHGQGHVRVEGGRERLAIVQRLKGLQVINAKVTFVLSCAWKNKPTLQIAA